MLGGPNPSRRPGGPDLERYLFWRGQLLKSRDLNDLNAGDEERLFWHNRAVHDAYGVVIGLGVTAGTGAAPEVTVDPGLAYDAYGRELAVFAETPVPMPSDVTETDEVWVLLLRHREDTARVDGCGCQGAGAPRSELVWRRARQAGIRDGVALARGRWTGGTTDRHFELENDFLSQRARPFARPRLGHGETPHGGTPWQPWSQPAPLSRRAVGIEVSVDTSAAGFTRTPCYFAWLQGGPWQPPHRLASTLLLDRITETSHDRFTFSLWAIAPRVFSSASETGKAFAVTPRGNPLITFARQRLYVCWLGIEAAPAVSHADLSALARLRKLEPR